jgi:hypothetical protein
MHRDLASVGRAKAHSADCFANAAKFMARFCGETFDPAQRGKGTNWMQWKK